MYSSRSRQKWKEWEHVSRHAPDGWKESHLEHAADEEEGDVTESEIPIALSGNSTWAKLIAKIYDVDPLCLSTMRWRDEGSSCDYGFS